MYTAADLPPLRHVSVNDLSPDDTPTPKIRTDEDLEMWKATRGYQDYGLFLRRLTQAVVGCPLPWTEPVGEVSGTLSFVSEFPNSIRSRQLSPCSPCWMR